MITVDLEINAISSLRGLECVEIQLESGNLASDILYQHGRLNNILYIEQT